ncbi:MAG TPA: hypothetical protein EYN70_05035 [Planctomycetaceae bacterium]|nr:hypothetical protein [Planctomycetaceae bacterium]
MPHASEQRIGEVVPALNGTMKEFQVNTIERKAAFLAQLAHESGELRYMEEWASGWAYEGRADLGNVQRGDGPRYKGRGPLQLTGRANYRAAGNALGLDLENDPALAANPATGMRIAGWFWDSRNLNTLVDQGDFQGITRRINGGLNGWENRLGYYQRALEILREPSAARELAGPRNPDDSTIENTWSGHLKPDWFWRDRFLLGRFWKLWGGVSPPRAGSVVGRSVCVPLTSSQPGIPDNDQEDQEPSVNGKVDD